MFCQKCGKQLADDAAFCGYCGCACTIQPPQKTENTILLIPNRQSSPPTSEQTEVITQPVIDDAPETSLTEKQPNEQNDFIGNFTELLKKLKTNKKFLAISISAAGLIVIAIAVSIIISLITPDIVGSWGSGSISLPVIYTFNSDHTGKEIVLFRDSNGNYDGNISYNFTWEITDNKLTLNYTDRTSSSGDYIFEIDHDFLLIYETSDFPSAESDEITLCKFTGKKLSNSTNLSNEKLLTLSDDCEEEVYVMDTIRLYLKEPISQTKED